MRMIKMAFQWRSASRWVDESESVRNQEFKSDGDTQKSYHPKELWFAANVFPFPRFSQSRSCRGERDRWTNLDESVWAESKDS